VKKFLEYIAGAALICIFAAFIFFTFKVGEEWRWQISTQERVTEEICRLIPPEQLIDPTLCVK
jgi:hypothetical protein